MKRPYLEKVYFKKKKKKKDNRALERLIHKQIGLYINHFLSSYIYGYKKSFSNKHALLSLIEKWKMVGMVWQY